MITTLEESQISPTVTTTSSGSSGVRPGTLTGAASEGGVTGDVTRITPDSEPEIDQGLDDFCCFFALELIACLPSNALIDE